MIKAEDLRIGDLVRVSRGLVIRKGTVCTVSDIRPKITFWKKKGIAILIPNKDNHEPWEVWCDDIEGVLLTPEILEKNGWKTKMYVGSQFFCIELNCYMELCATYVKEDDNFSVGIFSLLPGGDLDIIYFPKDVRYVHELQHILWALGLDSNLKI